MQTTDYTPLRDRTSDELITKLGNLRFTLRGSLSRLTRGRLQTTERVIETILEDRHLAPSVIKAIR